MLLLDFYFAAFAYAPILNLGLTASFITNDTGTALLFSDNPVQVYNSFYPHSHGLGMAGLVIIFPIHSCGFVAIYDEKMINLNSKQMTIDDVKSYNMMLITNCEQKIYFQDDVNQQYFRGLIEETMEYRNASYFNTLGPEDSKVAFLNFPHINSKILAQAGHVKYNWNKMNDIVDLYWENKAKHCPLLLMNLTNKI